MGHQQLYWRNFSQSSHCSHSCSNQHGLIWKYSLSMCRGLRLYAKDAGIIRLD
ncbi:hypothetical protein DBR06_SOUSAS1810147, partial [Sousa chinensis]